REQLHLQPPLVDGLHGLGVAREVRADRAPELTVAQQPAPAETRLAYVVPYVGQVAHVGLGQRVEQVHGVARHAEPADQERIPALNETRRLGRGDHGGDLHALSFGSSTTVASPCPTPTHSVAKP